MVIRLSIPSRRKLIIGLLVLGLLFAGFVVLQSRQEQRQAQAEYYSIKLSSLKNDTDTISALNKRDDIKISLLEQITKYQDSLKNIQKTCQDIDDHSEKNKENTGLKTLKDQIDKTRALCKDLKTVTDYAQKQSEVTRDFLLFPATSLVASNTLSKFQGILNDTKSSLEKLKQDPIDDPAVPEQLVLLQQLQQLTQKSSGKLDEIVKKVQLHQSNFLNARTYYWSNTIDIEAIGTAVDKLKDQFK